MSKTKKALVLSALVATTMIPLSSCGGGKKLSKDTLNICVYEGGYGTEWIRNMAEKYEKKTGVSVSFKADASVLSRIESALNPSSSTACYDIYMSHDIAWQTYASKGWLTPLDDLYEEEVEGTGKKFSERLIEGAAEVSRYTYNSEEHYYKVCWTQGVGGIVYNVDLFEANGWEVPTTYDELVSLCETIVASNTGGGHGSSASIAPFAWSGSARQYYWDYIVFEWWAELAGLDKIETVKKYLGPTGEYADGYEMYNPETYYKEFIQAYDLWYDLIALNSDYSVDNAYSSNLLAAQMAFVNQNAAMIPYAHWAKNEIEKAAGGDLGFDIAMMEVPSVSSSSVGVNYNVGFGDSIIVPAKAENNDLAKDFIRYMATEEACADFVEDTKGSFLAFDYGNVSLSDEAENDTFIASVKKKISDNTNFNLVSTNPIAVRTTDIIMPWIKNNYYYAVACQDPSKYTAETVGATIYNTAKSGWASWLGSAGL